MMYNNRFVVAIRVNGKILREQNQIVMLPFGAEYEILLKNLNSRRAMVGVSIDGTRTSDCRFVIPANSEITLERYIHKGNLDSGNRFKFIERTAAVEKHRGVGSDDGLVRAEFWAEREHVSMPKIDFYKEDWPYGRRRNDRPYFPFPDRRRGPRLGGPMRASLSRSPSASAGPTRSRGITGQSIRSFAGDDSGFVMDSVQGGSEQPGMNFTAQNMNVSCSAGSDPYIGMSKLADVNDAGITVPGSESYQQFHHVSGFELETNSTVIVLQLKGQVGQTVVSTPVTVERKPVCSTCGRTNKATNKFCSECGTALQLI